MEAFNNNLVIRYLDRVVMKDDGYEMIFKASNLRCVTLQSGEAEILAFFSFGINL